MTCYYYCILNDQEMKKEGFIHASSSNVAVDRFRKEILPTLGQYTSVEFKEMACTECQGTTDVVGFFLDDEADNGAKVLCKSCLMKFAQQIEATSKKTLTA